MHPEDLVKILAADAEPVRRLSSPTARLLTWLGVSVAYAAAIVWLMGLRPDIQPRLADTRFAIELGATFLTSVLAAAAAFSACSPGRPIWERFAPLPALGLWLWSLGDGCWRALAGSGAEGLAFRLDFGCLPSILLVSLVPGALMLKMIRQGAPIAPITTTALAALAAGALGATALRLFHAQDASLMVLVWQFGSVAFLAGLSALIGRQLLPWPAPQIAASSTKANASSNAVGP